MSQYPLGGLEKISDLIPGVKHNQSISQLEATVRILRDDEVDTGLECDDQDYGESTAIVELI
jgi:hypothetical protein